MAAIRGCLLKKSVAQTGADISTGDNAITFDSEVYDTEGFHVNAGVNNTKITIPASVNGVYGILTGCLSTTLVNTGINGYCLFYKNGSQVGIGQANRLMQLNGNGQSTASSWMQITRSPVLLATNDAYEFRANIGDGSITINAETNFGLYVNDNQTLTQRCLAALSGNLTTQNFTTPAALSFAGTDVYDTDAIHDPSGTPTKLIIPSSLNNKMGVVLGNIHTSLVATGVVASLAIRKTPSGGAASLIYDGFGAHSATTGSLGAFYMNVQTNVIPFFTGDAYELLVFVNDSSITVTNNNATALGLWVYGDSPTNLATPIRSFGTIIR